MNHPKSFDLWLREELEEWRQAPDHHHRCLEFLDVIGCLVKGADLAEIGLFAVIELSDFWLSDRQAITDTYQCWADSQRARDRVAIFWNVMHAVIVAGFDFGGETIDLSVFHRVKMKGGKLCL